MCSLSSVKGDAIFQLETNSGVFFVFVVSMVFHLGWASYVKKLTEINESSPKVKNNYLLFPGETSTLASNTDFDFALLWKSPGYTLTKLRIFCEIRLVS